MVLHNVRKVSMQKTKLRQANAQAQAKVACSGTCPGVPGLGYATAQQSPELMMNIVWSAA